MSWVCSAALPRSHKLATVFMKGVASYRREIIKGLLCKGFNNCRDDEGIQRKIKIKQDAGRGVSGR